MMRFTCERCGKRYAAHQIVPVPGRIYRLKCKACGHLITANGSDVLRTAERAEAAAEPSGAAPATDPTPAASASAFLDLPLSEPAAHPPRLPHPPQAEEPPHAPRDPFALENIVDHWPVEVTGSHPLVPSPGEPASASADRAGAETPEASAAKSAAFAHDVPRATPIPRRETRAAVTPAPAPLVSAPPPVAPAPRRKRRLLPAVAAVAVLAVVVVVGWQVFLSSPASAPAAPRTERSTGAAERAATRSAAGDVRAGLRRGRRRLADPRACRAPTAASRRRPRARAGRGRRRGARPG